MFTTKVLLHLEETRVVARCIWLGKREAVTEVDPNATETRELKQLRREQQ